FNEYVAALKGQGKPTKGITIQAFTAKLRLIEGGLKQKWKGCRMVRFKVNTQGAEVNLKPIPINGAREGLRPSQGPPPRPEDCRRGRAASPVVKSAGRQKVGRCNVG